MATATDDEIVKAALRGVTPEFRATSVWKKLTEEAHIERVMEAVKRARGINETAMARRRAESDEFHANCLAKDTDASDLEWARFRAQYTAWLAKATGFRSLAEDTLRHLEMVVEHRRDDADTVIRRLRDAIHAHRAAAQAHDDEPTDYDHALWRALER
jgi:hypothetical protein